jgi:hypothetical protein
MSARRDVEFFPTGHAPEKRKKKKGDEGIDCHAQRAGDA